MKKSKKILAILALAATCGVATTGCSLSDANSEEMKKLIGEVTASVNAVVDKKISNLEEQEAKIILINAVTNSSLQTKIELNRTVTTFAYRDDDNPKETKSIRQIQGLDENGNIKLYTKAKMFAYGKYDGTEYGYEYDNELHIPGEYVNVEVYRVCLEKNKCYSLFEKGSYGSNEKFYIEGYISVVRGTLGFDFTNILSGSGVEFSGFKQNDVTTIYVSYKTTKTNRYDTFTIKDGLIQKYEIVKANDEADGYSDLLDYSISEYKYNENVEIPNFPTSTQGYTYDEDFWDEE